MTLSRWPEPTPEAKRLLGETLAYLTGQKRVRHAHTIVTLCRFGRWMTWALTPRLGFFHQWTHAKPGEMSTELKAKLSLRKPISFMEAVFSMSMPGLLAAFLMGRFKKRAA